MYGRVSNSTLQCFTCNVLLFYNSGPILDYRLGEVCSHVAAVLFKVEACIRLGVSTLTCTSLPCVWNQAFSKKVSLNVNKNHFVL